MQVRMFMHSIDSCCLLYLVGGQVGCGESMGKCVGMCEDNPLCNSCCNPSASPASCCMCPCPPPIQEPDTVIDEEAQQQYNNLLDASDKYRDEMREVSERLWQRWGWWVT